MVLSKKLFINVAFGILIFVGLCYLSKAQFLPTLVRYSICTIIMATLAILPIALIIFSAHSLWKHRRFESLLLLTFSVLLAGFFVGPYTRMTLLYMQAFWQHLTGSAVAPRAAVPEKPLPQEEKPAPAQPVMEEPAEQESFVADQPSQESQEEAQGIVEISNTNELKSLLSSSKKPVVFKVSTAWCGPCKMLKPNFEKVAEELADSITFAETDGDTFDGKPEYGVKGYPTVIIFNNGQEVSRFGGYREKEDLRKEILRKLGM